jgi:crossover junction endodeoxyribonuclease RuvC
VRVFIGIDPGVSGAIACVADDGQVRVDDAPTIETRRTRRDYIVSEMRTLLRIARDLGTVVSAVIEDVHPMPQEGVASAGAFMRGVGLWEGLLAGLGIPYWKIPPQVWKKEFGLSMPPLAKPVKGKTLSKKDRQFLETERRRRKEGLKAKSVVIAAQMFPMIKLTRKKDHGRAEALLLAEYGRRRGQPAETPAPNQPRGDLPETESPRRFRPE